MVHRQVTLIFVPMYPSNQVFSIQLISVYCRSPHPWATSKHLQLADAQGGAGERTEGGSWSSREEESRGRGSVCGLHYWNVSCFGLRLLRLWRLNNGRKESIKLLFHICRNLGSKIGIEWLCSNWTRMMQRRHSASIMGRHQDNAHPPKQVQYWLNWSLSPSVWVYAAVCACACTCTCALSLCACVCVCAHVQKK